VIIDLKARIDGCENFYWYEALAHRDWNSYIFPTLRQKNKIISIAKRLELVRAYFGHKPIVITSWLRIKPYNKLIEGAKNSPHLYGMGVDFVIPGIPCDKVRKKLLPCLEEYDLRMENLPGAKWIHVDSRLPIGDRRYFKP